MVTADIPLAADVVARWMINELPRLEGSLDADRFAEFVKLAATMRCGG